MGRVDVGSVCVLIGAVSLTALMVSYGERTLTCFSFLNLGNPTRSLATKDPTFDTYLPVDDFTWDNGVSPCTT